MIFLVSRRLRFEQPWFHPAISERLPDDPLLLSQAAIQKLAGGVGQQRREHVPDEVLVEQVVTLVDEECQRREEGVKQVRGVGIGEEVLEVGLHVPTVIKHKVTMQWYYFSYQ